MPQSAHRTFSALRSLLASTVLIVVSACASVPNVKPVLNQPTSGEIPQLVSAHGPLSEAQSKAVIDRLATEARPSDVLARHLAIEEAVAETPLVTGNKTTLLPNGEQAFHAIFQAIRQARKHVHLEYYEVEDIDDGGEHLSDLLLAKRREGVQVALIYDSYGSGKTPASFFDRLKAADVALVSFNPVNPLEAHASYSPNDRDHRKILVADGALAIVGGVNLSTDYESGSGGSGGSSGKSKNRKNEPPEYWQDTDMQIEGPVVAQLQKLFLETWKQQKGPALEDAEFFPKIAPKGSEVVRVIGSGPDEKLPRYYVTLLSAIRNAEHSIWIATAYFVPTDEEVADLKHAARRGVDVRLLLPGKSDSSLSLAVGHSHYSELLHAGVKIYEARDEILHSKSAVIDGVWSVIGSSNFDHRSVLFNDEVDAVVLGGATASAMQDILESETQSAVAIDPAAWSRRPFGDRLREQFGQIWQSLL
jgi:cardiolipin synthase A/B